VLLVIQSYIIPKVILNVKRRLVEFVDYHTRQKVYVINIIEIGKIKDMLKEYEKGNNSVVPAQIKEAFQILMGIK
jgi:hypothetical protein